MSLEDLDLRELGADAAKAKAIAWDLEVTRAEGETRPRIKLFPPRGAGPEAFALADRLIPLLAKKHGHDLTSRPTSLVPDAVQAFLSGRASGPSTSEPVLELMTRRAIAGRFPYVGPEVGLLLETVARLRGARSVFEVGSGFGYSAYFFARAVGRGEIHLTDFDGRNLELAKSYLERAGFATRFHFHEGAAMEHLKRELARGPFDLYLVDADKERYPEYWEVIRPRMRPGDAIVADNLLWGGDVADPSIQDADTKGLRRFSELAANDRGIRFTLLPVRDGVGIAVAI